MLTVLILALRIWVPFWRTKTPVQFPNQPTPEPTLYLSLPEQPILALLPVTYKVQSADSSWHIAEAFYGSPFNYADIETANKMTPDQNLETGQILLIPSAPVRSAENAATGSGKPKFLTHRTSQTDTLWLIAQKYYRDGGKWSVIYSANKRIIKNPDQLEAGLLLVIPQ